MSTFSGQSPSIPGPYHNPEQTESFPLKQAVYGGALGGSERSRRWKSVLNCCTLGSTGIADEGGASLRVIVVCFMVLSFAVAIALAVQIYYGDYQLVPHGSVATDSRECSVIGTEILKKGGNAVDAAIAATFCLAVTNLHVTGIGGGGFMLIYSHRKRKVLDAIDFREMAPSTVNVSEELPGSMVGVPGFVMGLAVSHNLHGKLPWKDVVMPAVHLARSGFKIPQTMIWAQSRLNASKYNTKLLAAISVLEAGKNLTLPKLAGTLELIAERGPYVLYNGSLSKDILATTAEAGGLMTAADLLNFKVKRYPPQNMLFTKYNIHVPGLPSGGPLLLETLKSLNDLESAAESYEIILKLLADSSRETYNKVLTGFWGDPNNTSTTEDISGIPPHLPEPAGSHVAAVDLNDMYVSVVSGLNTWYGSQLLTNGSFVLNNALQNFGQGSNKAGPGRRPLSLATPIIAVEANRVCGRRLVLGAGDALVGAQLLSHLLLLEKNLGPSVEAARFHTLASNNISWQLGFEDDVKPGFGEKIQTFLTHAGYHIIGLKEPYQSCNAVEKIGDNLTSHSDSRGGGVASRF